MISKNLEAQKIWSIAGSENLEPVFVCQKIWRPEKSGACFCLTFPGSLPERADHPP